MTQHGVSFESRISSALRWIQDWKFDDDRYWSFNTEHVTITPALPMFLNIAISLSIRAEKRKGGQHKAAVKSKEWIVNKKATRRKQGITVKGDSKYTGRKRHAAF